MFKININVNEFNFQTNVYVFDKVNVKNNLIIF